MRAFYIAPIDDTKPLIPVECGWLNGYSFGQRLLEDVMFKITVGEDGELKAEVGPKSAAYFSGLNTTKWLDAAVEYAHQQDLFASSEDGLDDDVVLYDHSKPYNEQQAHFETEPTFVK